MNISYQWLKDLIDTDLPVQDVAAELTRVGLAVEGIHPFGDDHVLDIDLTSNRPDCLSHFGIARELSVSSGGILNIGDSSFDETISVEHDGIVSVQDTDLCQRFTARIIRGVKVGSSPDWLVKRLEAVGERSINNIADITNYVMLELGQPMHAFDLDKLAENRIIVRRASDGETIRTLDEVERKLDRTMLAICDAEKPVAVAGVMGGFDSGISDATVNVLLEVAYFDRSNIRSTSRKLNLATEASYRFERGVDINNLNRASDRAASLIVELAGGVLGEFVDVDKAATATSEIESSDIAAAVTRLTGLEVGRQECDRILAALGIKRKAGTNVYLAPSWRHDIAIEEDLVEEIARHAGYENIAELLPPAFGAGEYQPTESRERKLRTSLANYGFTEALSYSFIDEGHDGQFEIVPGVVDETSDEKFVTLRDSVIEGALRMRPTILPGLLDSVRLNLNRKRRDLKLFEMGKVFATQRSEDGLPNEQKLLAIVMTGSESLGGRAKPGSAFDFYDLKGAIETALEAVGLSGVDFEAAQITHLRKGQAATVSVDGSEIGYIGRLSDELSAGYKFKQPVYLAEINLSSALAANAVPAVYTPLTKYPAVVRDVSFVVGRTVSFDSIRGAVIGQGNELCRGVTYVDLFEGKGLADGEVSLTIRLEYRSDERTLTEDEVETVHAQLLDGVEQSLGIRRQA